MGAEKAIGVAVGLLIIVLISGSMFAIYKQGGGMTNKGLSEAAKLSAKFNDVDKQKYDGMTLTGDAVLQVISDYWDDSTCEVVVCTLDGINAVYNKESTDGTYTVPFSEAIGGMPTAACKGRVFPADTSINTVPETITATAIGEGDKSVNAYDVAQIAALNVTNGVANGPAVIVDAAKLVQNPTGTKTLLATENGYNSLATVGSGGYVSTTSNFIGRIQKDTNGTIRLITFIQQ